MPAFLICLLLCSCGDKEYATALPNTIEVKTIETEAYDKYLNYDYEKELEEFLSYTNLDNAILFADDGKTTLDSYYFKNDYDVVEISATRITHKGYVTLGSYSSPKETKTKKVNIKLSQLLKGNYDLVSITIRYNGEDLILTNYPYNYDSFRITSKDGTIFNEDATLVSLYLNSRSSFIDNEDGTYDYFIYTEGHSLQIHTNNRAAAEGFIRDEIS